MSDSVINLPLQDEAGEFVNFIRIYPIDGRKTNQWAVHSRMGGLLIGQINWFGRWRKYCFFPAEKSVFDHKCLREIANFTEQKTKKYAEDRCRYSAAAAKAGDK